MPFSITHCSSTPTGAMNATSAIGASVLRGRRSAPRLTPRDMPHKRVEDLERFMVSKLAVTGVHLFREIQAPRAASGLRLRLPDSQV